MSRRAIVLAAVLLMLAFTVPAAAQQSGWSVYLFDSVSQHLLRVFLDGTQQTYDLGIPQGSYIGQRSLDFTSDGNRVAYCVPVNDTNGANSTLYIKDIASAEALVTVPLGIGDGCWVTYSADNAQVAVGIVRYYPGAPGDADTTLPPWQLLVFDAASGQQLYEMNAEKLAPAGLDPEPRLYMPDVRYFSNSQIIFAALPWGTEGFPISPAFFWQLGGDTVQAIDRWWRWGIDSLSATGELVWLEQDESIPVADPGGPTPRMNIVKLAGQTGDERIIYANPEWVLIDTAFIDNGRQLAIGELEAFDPATGDFSNQHTRWMALNRDGSVSELASGVGFSQILAAPDGYVLLSASSNNFPATQTLEYRSGREDTMLWQVQVENGAFWQLLWAAPTATADGLAAFPTVTP